MFKFKSKKHKMISFVTLLSLPIMLSFQNCSQQGSLSVSGSGLATNSNVDNPQSSDDGGMVVVAPPTYQIPVDNPGQVSNPPSSNPPVSTNPVDNPPSSNPGTVTPPSSGDDTVHTQDCRNIEIADIKLSIDSVSAGSVCTGNGNKKSAEFEIVSAESIITLTNPSLKLRALQSGEVKELFVKLDASGNQVLSMDNVAMDLVTPSAQQSGLKVQLKQSVKVVAGQEYTLKFDIRAEDQIVANPVKCLLKPVIKSATLK